MRLRYVSEKATCKAELFQGEADLGQKARSLGRAFNEPLHDEDEQLWRE